MSNSIPLDNTTLGNTSRLQYSTRKGQSQTSAFADCRLNARRFVILTDPDFNARRLPGGSSYYRTREIWDLERVRSCFGATPVSKDDDPLGTTLLRS
nr:uncharacterized protein CTRU02_14067 [Colletotrichum truncatum]KAF6782586.1 hypothetical protein CTRU02_14067 [Colletotrichum truncatum]